MNKSIFYTNLLLRAKLRSKRLLAAEVFSPAAIMLITFTLGWAISTVDIFQVNVFAKSTFLMIRNEADILVASSRKAGIPACLSPLATEMEARLLRRRRDGKAAHGRQLLRQDDDHTAQSSTEHTNNTQNPTHQHRTLQHLGQQQQEPHHSHQQHQVQRQAADRKHHRSQWPWWMKQGTLQHNLNVSRSPGEAAGRNLVMALLEAVKNPQVVQALEECRWHDMLVQALQPTLVNIFNQVLGPAPLPTFDEWLLLASSLNATLAASSHRSTLEYILGYLIPAMPVAGLQPGWLALVPDTPQVRTFADYMSATSLFFNDVFLGVFDTVEAAMDASAKGTVLARRGTTSAATSPDSSGGAESGNEGVGQDGAGYLRRPQMAAPSRLWAVLEFASGPDPGVGVDYSIRMDAMHVPGTFTKLSPPECRTCSNDYVPYVASGFMSLQAAVSGYVVGLGAPGSPSAAPAARSSGPGTSPLSEATAWLNHTEVGGGSSNRTRNASLEPPSSDVFGVWLTPLPNMGHEVNAFYEYSAPLIGLVTTSSITLPLIMLVRSMTSQRQSGLQHLLEVLGLSSTGWRAAWMLAGFMVMVACFGLEALLAGCTYLQREQPRVLAAVMGAAAAAAAGWAVLLGGCFKGTRVATMGSFMMTVAGALPFLALYTAAPTQLLVVRRLCCLMWPFALSTLLHRMAVGNGLHRHGAGTAVASTPGLDWSSATRGPLSTVELIAFLMLDALIYLALAEALAVRRGVMAWCRALGGDGEGGVTGWSVVRKDVEKEEEEEVALEVQGVTHCYPGNTRRALEGVNLRVRAGEAVALLGLNAAGKSTLVAISSGSMRPNGGGHIRVTGYDLCDSGAGRRASRGGSAYRHLGYCPQGNVLVPDLTVGEHLELALVMRGALGTGRSWGGMRRRREAAVQLARRVALPEDMLQRLVNQLSGGSQRKLQLALAMAGEPSLLLLDEVTAGVDAESRQAIWKALLAAKRGPWGCLDGGAALYGTSKGLRSCEEGEDVAGGPVGRGAALLFTSHYLPEVEQLSDWLAVLEQGRLQSLTPAGALRSLLELGAHRVLRITTRPAPYTYTGLRKAAETPAHSAPTSSDPVSSLLSPRFTRVQLLDRVLRHMGRGTTRVLYSNWTFTAVYVHSAAVAARVADGDGSTRIPTRLEMLLREIMPQPQPQLELESPAQSQMTPLTATAITTTSDNNDNNTSCSTSVTGGSPSAHDWECQPLVVVRCGLGPPSVEDVVLLGLGLETGAGSAVGGGVAVKAGEIPASRHVERDGGCVKAALGLMGAPPGSPSTPGTHPTSSTMSWGGSTKSVNLDPDSSMTPSKGQQFQPSPHALHRAAPFASSPQIPHIPTERHGVSSVLFDLITSLPPLLAKQRLILMRDHSSTARLLLIPLAVIAMAVVILSLKPPSSGPPAPLNLGWLGQQHPVPTIGLPPSWWLAASTTTTTTAVIAPSGAANYSSHLWGSNGVGVPGPGEEGLWSLGLVPLRPEWVVAAAEVAREAEARAWEGEGEGEREGSGVVASSVHVSAWFLHRVGKAVGEEGQELGSAPMQSALVFGDVMTSRVMQTAWSLAGWCLETLLAPQESLQMGLVDVPDVRSSIRTMRHEEGGMWKMLDFLYDRMLLNEFIRLIRFVTGADTQPAPVPPTTTRRLFDASAAAVGEAAHATASGAAVAANDSANTAAVSGSVIDEGSSSSIVTSGGGSGRGGSLFSFFHLGLMEELCNLVVPVGARALGAGGVEKPERGGRRLLMKYRPSVNVSLYLLAGLLPLEPRFCPLAQLLVAQSNTTAELFRRHMTRRALPGLNVMWNVTSPHGPPAALNHLHNVMLRLKTPQTPATTTTTTSNTSSSHGSVGDGGSSAPSRRLRGQGASASGDGWDGRSYSERVYGSTAIRVRNHPLPPRGSKYGLVGLIQNMMMALLVVLPLAATTGSFVVRAASEAASGAKQQQLVAGRVTPLSYWLSFWLPDVALHLVLGGGVVALMTLGRMEAFTGNWTRAKGVAMLLAAFAAASLPWGYCVGLTCSSPSSAQGVVTSCGLGAGVAFALCRQVLSHVPRWSGLASRLLPLFRLMPHFCLADGLMQMALHDVIMALSQMLGHFRSKKGLMRYMLEAHLVGIDPTNPDPFQSSVLGDNITFLALDALLYTTVLLAVEWGSSRGSCWFMPSPFPRPSPGRPQSANRHLITRLRGILGFSVGMETALEPAVLGGREQDDDTHDDDAVYGSGGTIGVLSRRHKQNLIKGEIMLPYTDPGGRGSAGSGGGDTANLRRTAGADSCTTMCVSEAAEQLEAVRGIARLKEEEAKEAVERRNRKECAVRVCNVCKTFGRGRPVVALSDVSFQIRSGECLGLLGRNGAGKSTALAVLSGRLLPNKGSVEVGGVQVAGRLLAARGRVAVCPQTNPLLPLLTPTEHLILYGALYGTLSAKLPGDRLPPDAAALAFRCGLPLNLLHQPAGQLSGGSQRKLSLALALLGSPMLLLLDEPSAGMDPAARRDMCDAVNMAVRGDERAGTGVGTAVVLTTHYAEEAVALCDIVGVLEMGRLVACGAPEQVPGLLRRRRATEGSGLGVTAHYLEDPEEWGDVLVPLLGR